MQQTDQHYQKLLTEVIKKEILILGPAISLAKARNVKGLTISEDGTVTAISGNPQELTQQLIDQFMELSSLIVKKTMEPILTSHPGLILSSQTPTVTSTPPDPIKSEIIPEPIPSPQITISINTPPLPMPAPLEPTINESGHI
jgi:hypothetical protein